jgi:hypothetical protein
LLPAGAVAGWGLHPLESAAFARRTPNSEVGGSCREVRFTLNSRLRQLGLSCPKVPKPNNRSSIYRRFQHAANGPAQA